MRIRREFLQAYREKYDVSMDEANILLRQVEAEHIAERLRLTDLFDPEPIDSDQFSHQEDAYWAGFSTALKIVKEGIDGFE